MARRIRVKVAIRRIDGVGHPIPAALIDNDLIVVNPAVLPDKEPWEVVLTVAGKDSEAIVRRPLRIDLIRQTNGPDAVAFVKLADGTGLTPVPRTRRPSGSNGARVPTIAERLGVSAVLDGSVSGQMLQHVEADQPFVSRIFTLDLDEWPILCWLVPWCVPNPPNDAPML